MLGRFVAAVAIVAGITSAASAQDVKLPENEFGRYHALVIGNNDYQHLRNLTTAVGDADAVAKLLEQKYGFQVTKLINATRRDIAGALNRLRQTLTEKDNLLVYYAGHGVLDEEAGAGIARRPTQHRPLAFAQMPAVQVHAPHEGQQVGVVALPSDRPARSRRPQIPCASVRA